MRFGFNLVLLSLIIRTRPTGGIIGTVVGDRGCGSPGPFGQRLVIVGVFIGSGFTGTLSLSRRKDSVLLKLNLSVDIGSSGRSCYTSRGTAGGPGRSDSLPPGHPRGLIGFIVSGGSTSALWVVRDTRAGC